MSGLTIKNLSKAIIVEIHVHASYKFVCEINIYRFWSEAYLMDPLCQPNTVRGINKLYKFNDVLSINVS